MSEKKKKQMSPLLLFFLIVQTLTCNSFHAERNLLVMTCDTRNGWKEFNALKLWNVTGWNLKKEGLPMVNVCRGENWGKLGFLTKPLKYLSFLKDISKLNSHAILMDSDTYWGATSIEHIWKNYDLARSGKNLVVSTEMSCWVGRYCVQSDLDRWYHSPASIPSFSPFVNSGVLMGRVDNLIKMLEFVVANNKSYFTTYGNKHKFDDQLAIADYALKVLPEEVAVDYHQLISASCSIHAPSDPPEEGWPFVCKNRNGSFSFSCNIYNNLLRRQGHFFVNSSNCLVQRNVVETMSLSTELNTLSTTPIIWHGNGKHNHIIFT